MKIFNQLKKKVAGVVEEGKKLAEEAGKKPTDSGVRKAALGGVATALINPGWEYGHEKLWALTGLKNQILYNGTKILIPGLLGGGVQMLGLPTGNVVGGGLLGTSLVQGGKYLARKFKELKEGKAPSLPAPKPQMQAAIFGIGNYSFPRQNARQIREKMDVFAHSYSFNR